MLIKLDDAIAAVTPREDEAWSRDAMQAFEHALAALRALPVSDGWEDMATDKLDAWRFNVMLECQGGNGECVIGGAELNLNDLLAILDFVSDRCPLPAPPAIEGDKP